MLRAERFQPGTVPDMSILDHLRELRKRLTRACLAVLAGLGVGFWLVSESSPLPVVDYIIERFVLGSGAAGLSAVSVAETFTSYIGVALLIGISLAMPMIIYQLLRFVTPAMLPAEKRILLLGLPFVVACFVGGLAFGWFVTVPAALKFLLNVGNPLYIQNTPSPANFFALFTRLMLVSGLLFELPVIILLLARLNVLKPKVVGRYRRYIALGVVVISAIITPTSDPINLALVAVPMYLLFELGLLLARVTTRPA